MKKYERIKKITFSKEEGEGKKNWKRAREREVDQRLFTLPPSLLTVPSELTLNEQKCRATHSTLLYTVCTHTRQQDVREMVCRGGRRTERNMRLYFTQWIRRRHTRAPYCTRSAPTTPTRITEKGKKNHQPVSLSRVCDVQRLNEQTQKSDWTVQWT
jgi:hypothetical protein